MDVDWRGWQQQEFMVPDPAGLQEYMGSYVMNASGRLEFCEGPLLTAMRRGQWLIADELNLAPSDILEAFNRSGSPQFAVHV